MRRKRHHLLIGLVWGLVFAVSTFGAALLTAQQLGTIEFPNSGNASAQPFFLEGVKDLHSFSFDDASIAFQKAQRADPTFALAFWGEAMSHNHPLWAQQDLDGARQALAHLAPDAQARFALAKTPKERAYLEAQDQLFDAPGDKLARDMAYSQRMADMHMRWPEDEEITTFYALALLGTVRSGDSGFQRQALAASMLLPIFQRNPDHPGAAHLLIHAFDDPDHAVLALPAARVYARIAPSAAHALHMPSHTFVQLGMWEEVRTSNIAAYAAAEAVVNRLHVPEGREDFHTLAWLHYANLMLGRFDEAKQDLGYARAALARSPGNRAVQDGYLTIWARHTLETQQWANLPLNPDGLKPNASWLFIVGFCAAHTKDFDLARQAAVELGHLREQASKSDMQYEVKSLAVMQDEVEAQVALEQGDLDSALRLAKEASDIELKSGAPSGPPDPIKPATEFYAETLARCRDTANAALAFDHALMRTPNRTPAVQGLKATGYPPRAIYSDSQEADMPAMVHVH